MIRGYSAYTIARAVYISGYGSYRFLPLTVTAPKVVNILLAAPPPSLLLPLAPPPAPLPPLRAPICCAALPSPVATAAPPVNASKIYDLGFRIWGLGLGV